MYLPTLASRVVLLLAALVLLARPAAFAQRIYANRVISQVNTLNSGQAIDNLSTTQATLSPSLLAGSAGLRLGLPRTSEAGKPAGIVVNSGGLLTAAALASVAVNTYLSPSTTPKQHIQLGTLLSLGLLNGGQATAEFLATEDFDQIELEAGGLLNAYQIGVVAAYGTATPLPVQLVAFTGQAAGGTVHLDWQTASELHNDYFEIERSADGDTYAALGRVAGAGSSSTGRRYQFADAAPLALAYYRLRQVDADGTASFSPVVAVRAELLAGLQAFPTRTATLLTVASPAATRLDFFNQRGQLLLQTTVAAGQQQLDVSRLPAGLYLVRDATTGQRVKIEKQ